MLSLIAVVLFGGAARAQTLPVVPDVGPSGPAPAVHRPPPGSGCSFPTTDTLFQVLINDMDKCLSQKFADLGTWDGTLAGLDLVLAKLTQDDADYWKSVFTWDAVNLFGGKSPATTQQATSQMPSAAQSITQKADHRFLGGV